MKNFKFFGLSLLGLLLSAVMNNALAQFRYDYTGLTFTVTAMAPYTNTGRITGSFTVSGPLGNNLVNQTITGPLLQNFSFTDGQFTRTMANSTVCGFTVSTDNTGTLTSAYIWLRQAVVPMGGFQHSMEVGLDLTGSAMTANTTGCGMQALGPFASSSGAGSFVRVSLAPAEASQAVPTLGQWAMVSLVLLLGFLGVRRVNR
jgi:IPTL-CTERM motif